MQKLLILFVVTFSFLLSNVAFAEREHEYENKRETEHHTTIKKVVAPKITKKKKSTKTPTTPKTSTGIITKTQTVSYRAPDGMPNIGFSVTVKNGVITSATATKKAAGTSGYYQDAFIGKFSGAVVGKKVAGLKLSAIGGASLTTDAFESFISKNF